MLWSSISTLLLHIPLCWLMVFKTSLGYTGAALAISISYWLNVFMLATYIRFSKSCKETRSPPTIEAFRGWNGWEEFVNDHFIEAGDLLVFRYDDRSQFSVAVFSPTACEKESAFVAYPGHTVVVIEQEDNNGENIAVVRNSNMSILLPGESVETQRKKIRVSDHNKLRGHSSRNAALGTPKNTTSTDCVNLKEDEDENMAAVDNSKMLVLPAGESVGTKRKNVRTLGNASLGAPKVITSIGCENLKVVGKSQRIQKIISTWRPVTEEEKEKTLRSAKEFTSEKPFFLLKMTATYVYDGLFLHIPRKFSREYLSKMNSKMTLWNPDGNQWKVNYCYTSKSKNANFYGGWPTFLKENHLEEDDVCVFELIQETQMKVHIYRVVPEVSPRILQSSKK